MKPAQIVRGGRTYVELPHPAARTVGIEHHLERSAEIDYGLAYYEKIFLPFMEKHAPKTELMNTVTNEKLSLKDFSDCEDSDLRMMHELLPAGGRYKTEHLGKPRIVCLNCDSLQYRVPSEMGPIKHDGKELSKEAVGALDYFLAGGNKTLLSRAAALVVLDKYTRPIPKKGIPTWASAGVLNAILGQDSEMLYKVLAETGYVERKDDVMTLQAIGRFDKLIGYSITQAGKDFLHGVEGKTEGHLAFLHKKSIRKPLIDCLEARIEQVEETKAGNLSTPFFEEIHLKSKMGESEKERHIHNIYHIPDNKVRAIHGKQKRAFKKKLGFPEPRKVA